MRRLFFVLVWLCALPATATPRLGAIASAHPLATEAGFEVLAAGGNACDAAVAISAALAVVEPVSSGIGGGAFYLIQRRGAEALFVDARETAPRSATRDMYLGADGQPVRQKSLDGPLAAGIPGEPAALVHLTRRCGRLDLARNLAPAIRLAAEGFEPDAFHLQMTAMRKSALAASPAAATIFLDQGEPPKPGFRLVQKDLAAVLQRLARKGKAGFYDGETARLIIDGVNAAGGAWTAADLRDYKAVERTPLRGRYRDTDILTAPPPSSGGVALITALNILEGYALNLRDAVTGKHLIIEAMRRAYRDRAEYLGDPDFVAMPIAQLVSKDYAAGLRTGIRPDRATPSASLPGAPAAAEGTDTTHFSVVDTARQRGVGDAEREHPVRLRLRAAGHRNSAERRNGRFLGQGGQPQHLRPGRQPRQRHRAGQAAAVEHDADHPAPRRHAWPCWARPAAAASSAWCCWARSRLRRATTTRPPG